MKIQKLAATLLNVTRLIAFAGLLTLTAGSALAIPPGSDPPACGDMISNSCNDDLATLCAATDGADSLKDRDRDTLVSKVLGAATKLTQGKTSEADGKLQNYEDKLDSLVNATKAKITGTDADALSAALIDAQSCVDALP